MRRQVRKVNLKILKQNMNKLVKSPHLKKVNIFQVSSFECSLRTGEYIPTRPNVYRCDRVSVQIVEDQHLGQMI